MTPTQNWKSLFTEWPPSFPRGGVLVTSLNEMIAFRRFWIKGDMLLLERMAPDANGGRFVLLGFDVINSVKFTNPLTDKVISEAGFAVSESLAQLV